MEDKITVRQWIQNFNNHQYDNPDVDTQINAGWYDWFCKATSLKNKTIKMGRIIKKLTNPDILDNMYVFFKNNCPCSGPLYDQFKFCDMETGAVVYCICIDSVFEDFRYAVFGGKEKCWEAPIFATDKSKELVEWFNKQE